MTQETTTVVDGARTPATDATALVKAEAVLDARLTGPMTVAALSAALTAAAYVFEADDLVTLATAETLQVSDASDYTQGYALLAELADVEDRVATHYARFDKPLNALIAVVRGLKGPQVKAIAPVKTALAQRLGAWKTAEEQRARVEQARLQAEADRAAKAAQAQQAATLARVAETEADPALAESFRVAAAAVKAGDAHGAPVDAVTAVPKIPLGSSRTTWRAEVTDVKALLRAYLDGRCVLDEDALVAGLQASLDRQAGSLHERLGQAYPGVVAVPTTSAVVRRR
jgi:hypothetical protein